MRFTKILTIALALVAIVGSAATAEAARSGRLSRLQLGSRVNLNLGSRIDLDRDNDGRADVAERGANRLSRIRNLASR